MSSSAEDQPEKEKVVALKTEVLDQLFAAAVAAGASHIHLEPDGQEVQVRFRVGRQLKPEPSIPSGAKRILIARLKGLAHMDPKDLQHCQNGPFRFAIHDGTVVTGRISTLPSLNGETCVITIHPGEEILSLQELGMEPEQLETVNQLTAIRGGMTLVTGPWSSGKTLTLYALASQLKQTGLSIVSLEDPSELEIEGITQIQVSRRTGLTFASGMRAILRQDPDIILLGEIQDLEEATMAFDACIQARNRVIAGLHTPTVISAFRWLIDAGVKPDIVATAVAGIVIQRLVNRICPKCTESVSLSAQLVASVGFPIPATGPWMKGSGCENCNDTGYRGKTAIFEVVPVNEAMQEVLQKDPSPLLLKKALRTQRVPSLRRMGIKKAEMGITTVDEVVRVTT